VRRNIVVAVVLGLVVGFAAGALSGIRTRTVTKTEVVRAGDATACRQAVELANQGFGVAQQALGAARAASGQTPPTGGGAGGSLQAILGQGTAQLEGFRGPFLQARAGCEGTASASSTTTR
jgi:hypothetical protein